MGAAAAIERISLRRVSPTLGFAEVRLAAVNLCRLKVEETASGRLTVTPPNVTDPQGRSWGCYALQPGTREAIEREIGRLWRGDDTARRGGHVLGPSREAILSAVRADQEGPV